MVVWVYEVNSLVKADIRFYSEMQTIRLGY
jgi:hypothetical protein